MEPLRIYADKNLKADWAYIPLLFPFWGFQQKDSLPYLSAAFKTHGWDPKCFNMVEKPEEAEAIVFPHEYWWTKKNRSDLLGAYLSLSKKHAIPLLIDALSDTDKPINLPNALFLRNTMYRFSWSKNEIPTPYGVEDLLESYAGGAVVPREKNITPSVGFVGYLPQKNARSFLKALPTMLAATFDNRFVAHRRGNFWREKAMVIFENSRRVTPHFIQRSFYSGHLKTVEGDVKDNRQEFIDNLIGSDYSLAIRGDANASQRFYEALTLGRIPVLIDTECVLPLEDIINYSEFCVVVDYKNLERAPDIVADFHAQISPDTYRAMQFKAREVYEKYLRIDAFSQYLPGLVRSCKKYL